MDLAALQEKINNYITVVSSWVRNVGKLYFSGTAEDVTVQMIDDDGNVVDTTLPNVAKFRKTVWDDVGSAIGQFNNTFYVDSINGDDSNSGTGTTTAFKTLEKALNAVPVSGRGYIKLLSDVTLSISTTVESKKIVIDGQDALNHKNIYLSTSNDSEYTFARGIYLRNSNLFLRYIKVTTPNSISDTLPVRYTEGFIRRDDNRGISSVQLFDCELDIGDVSFVKSANGSTAIKIHLYSTEINKVGSGVVKGYLLYLDRNTGELSTSGEVLGVDDDGSDLTWSSLVAGIVKDSNGVPRNLVSNIIF